MRLKLPDFQISVKGLNNPEGLTQHMGREKGL